GVHGGSTLFGEIGPRPEPGRPLTMTRSIYLLAGLLLVGSIGGSGQNDEDAFATFFAGFQTAAAQRDHSTIAPMMSAHFDFFQAHNVAHSVVFSHLDADAGKQWSNLQHATQGSPVIVKQDYNGHAARMIQCTPTNELYRCLLVFQPDSQGHWLWKGM